MKRPLLYNICMGALLAGALTCGSMAARAQGIGTWKSYQSYAEVSEIQRAGNKIYVLASEGLYSYNTADGSLQTYDKVSPLSDTGISTIAWCQKAHRLVIVYTNGNIDLLNESGNVTNISDYYSYSTTADKTVNSLRIDGGLAYISTGFGVVCINVERAEVKDTYNLGFNVKWTHADNDYIYAESDTKGQYAAALTSNLLDKNNWQRTADYTAPVKEKDEELEQLVSTLDPGGPKKSNIGFGMFSNGLLLAVDNVWDGAANVQAYDGNTWQLYDDSFVSDLGHRYVDNTWATVDPLDKTHVVACGRTGVYSFRNGKLEKAYNNDNSLLQTAATVGNDNQNYVIVNGAVFDAQGNLWVTNSISPSASLLELRRDGTWVSHHHDEFLAMEGRSMENLVSMFFDHNGVLWASNDFYRAPALISYNPATDEAHSYASPVMTTDGDEVNLKQVRCAVEDLSGNIWIGSIEGPLMLERSEIDRGGEKFTRVKVPRNDGTNYADYLLSGIDVLSIDVDNAGRKWLGTNGKGVYLLSADNMQQQQHFTTDNSPLLDNTINKITINRQTGEVFFSTGKGICSYMSDVTSVNNEMTKETVWAYPNPVRPGYTGMVTIVGLTYGADVKILTSSGALVKEGKADGGSFKWDVTDGNGKRVASGVYMVHTANADGSKGVVCKVAVVN